MELMIDDDHNFSINLLPEPLIGSLALTGDVRVHKS